VIPADHVLVGCRGRRRLPGRLVAALPLGTRAQAEFAAQLGEFLHFKGEFPHGTRRHQPVNDAT